MADNRLVPGPVAADPHHRPPDEIVGLALRAPHGVITLDAAEDAGLERKELAALVRRGVLVRVAPGAFVVGEEWRCADAERRHVLQATAKVLLLGGRVALSHVSAAAFFRLPLLTPPGHRVHLVRTTPGSGRSRADFVVHRPYGLGALHAGVETKAVPAVVPVLAAFGVAELRGFVAGVVALDAALHTRLTTREDVEDWLGRLERRPLVRLLHRVASAADASCESPLETQVRLLLVSLGYEVVSQRVLRTEAGEFVARVDLYLPELGVVVEVDGRGKYRAEDGSGSTASVLSEKRREKAIVDLGYGVVRVEHADLERPAQIDQRIAGAAARVDRSRIPLLSRGGDSCGA